MWGRLQRERSRVSLVRVERLAKAGRFAEAYALATAAERWIRSDTTLARLLPLVADHLSIVTDPAGASASIERFSPDAPSPPGRAIGTTPIANLRLARGDYRVVITKDGFAPVERIASSAFQRFEFRFTADSTIRIRVKLPPKNGESDEMVRVDGGRHELVGPDAPAGTIATLDDFAIDRYEVTNENYKAFVRAGGYGRASLWQRDFVEQGKPVGASDAMRRFVDKTGLPSPRSWSNQDFPNGMSRHPVSDVSWYEAEAYCEWKGKQLPTLFQWEQAARGRAAAHGEAIVLPWGAAAPSEPANQRANLGTNGTTAVGSYPFGISPYGAYDMAGNVAEWTRTPVEQGFVSTGASFEDPVYVFAAYAFHDGFLATPTLGFRCGRTAAGATGDQGASLLRVHQRTPEYQPVSESAFRALRSHYEYDHRPLQAHVLERSSLPDWTREKIQYVAGNSDSVIAFLYLPRLVPPPYQTIVYVPSNAAFFGHPASDEVERVLAPHIKAGRAVWVAVLKGMIGHEWEPNHPPAPSNSVQFRDEMVLRATEVRRGLDYLESRPDIDHERLAYYGLSWGSGSRLVFAGVDDRFRSIVFVGGGIDERLHPPCRR